VSEPFIGEIKVISFNFPPKGWAFCNGQLLPINQNQALFSILGTTYGGDGRTTFALPNLQARMPIHQGPGFTPGQAGGEVAHTLSVNEMPAHTHVARARSAVSNPGGTPAGSVWAQSGDAMFAAAPTGSLAPAAIGNAGGGQPHTNEAPYLVLNFVIALQGIFPSRN
jgi:microcystin-dependent protein